MLSKVSNKSSIIAQISSTNWVQLLVLIAKEMLIGHICIVYVSYRAITLKPTHTTNDSVLYNPSLSTFVLQPMDQL